MTRFLRIGNRVVTLLLRMGLPVGRMALLTVTGRRTHLPRTTPVVLTRQGEGWLLIAVSGRAEWVRNLQKAEEGTITRFWRRISVESQELTPPEAAPILRRAFASLGPITRRVLGEYFETESIAPLEAWRIEAAHHPVFRLTRSFPPPPLDRNMGAQRANGTAMTSAESSRDTGSRPRSA